MQSLVIGGAGYIGSHIVYELCDQGHEVVVLDNLSTGQKINIDPRARFEYGDILHNNELEETLKKYEFDTVFHFAALKAAGESMEQPEKYAEHNLNGTINLLNAAARHGIRNVVFSSSAAVYGEPQYLPVDEGHPVSPVNFYGYTKLSIEQTLEWYSSLRGIRFAALRYFNAAGYDIKGRITGLEQNPANLLPIVMETASGRRNGMQVFGDDYPTEDGSCIRDYIHVSDLATAHVKAMEYLEQEDENLTLNLATGKGYSVFEVLRQAEAVTGRQIPCEITGRREGDPAKLVATSNRALEKIGWQAEHSELEVILESMWEVYGES